MILGILFVFSGLYETSED